MTRILLASGCVVVALGLAGCRREDPTAAAIRTTLADSTPGKEAQLVRRVYDDRDYRPLWSTGLRLEEDTKALIETLCHAEREGLRAADYDLAGIRGALERLSEGNDKTWALAELDIRLSRGLLDYGRDLLAGRLDPHAVQDGWYIRARLASIDSTLRAAIEKGEVGDMLASLRPRQREYEELVEALEKYREIGEKGGWSAVERGKDGTMERGDEGAAVGSLRYRLHATGDLKQADGKPVFDDEVAKAVAKFQERHGIPVDSTVGPATLAALNVPVEARIRQIELNLERYRWLPAEFGKRYILVNIPDYRLYAYDGSKEKLTMRVIVGDEYGNATPVFADSMTHVVFRPQWDIPRRILVDEVIPKVREDIYYLAKHSYEVVDTATHRVTDPASIDWDDLDSTNIHFRVRQKSGEDNALGNVKFMFPNQYSIYLHDTPADHLFRQNKRTLSHGCVRVEEPVKLAGYVLGWDEDKIREAMAEGRAGGESAGPVNVDLEKPIPVYLVYLTAFVRDGEVHFRDDPYQRDSRAIPRLGKPDPTLCDRLQQLAGERK
jgi:L,D-transpeptidase YcbB